MKWKAIILFSIMICATMLFGGNRLAGETNKPQKRSDLSDPSQPISVKAGEEFTIALFSNPSTGYTWEFAEPLDDKMLQLSSRKYVSDAPQLDGSGGIDRWTFRALKKGTTHIFLKYLRPWEKNKIPARISVFTIYVEE